jgi:2-(3-amino-3-carboxypropyl)histidine synthase
MYDFEPEKVKRFLKRHRVRRAAIQLPPGLREHLPEIRAPFDEAGIETLVLGDSCHGACDLADAKAERLGCGVLVHYGHADMGLKTSLPTLYVEARMTADPIEAIRAAAPRLKFKRLGLVTTVQHIGFLLKAVKSLRSLGIKPLIGKPGPRAKYDGQVLGCDWGSARSISGKVDGFLYIGTGKFHPLGVSLATGKEVVTVNPVTGGCEKLTPGFEDFLRRRRAAISRAAACDEFGIVVSVKLGQARFKLAAGLINAFKRAGLTAHMIALDEIAPEKLDDFKLGALVCAACPRLPIDDAERFSQPILTPFEARVMLGKASLEPYQLDEVRNSDF